MNSIMYIINIDTSIQQRVLTASRGPPAAPQGPNAPFPAPTYVPSPASSLCTSKPKTFWTKFTRLFTRKSKTTTNVDNDDTGRPRWLIIKGGVAIFQFWKDKLDNFQICIEGGQEVFYKCLANASGGIYTLLQKK
ncbi:hypothetical protein GIB67_007186 [Kingdonia uniflora]|uniref:Uncharacterized protein n=1 Tax=Kingdonia uniflora TaxID=39325 RepID=A0A7J7ND84_9MAGN|nr:hypothetical protein GIB67_007186 [Kingdonia uniflora]